MTCVVAVTGSGTAFGDDHTAPSAITDLDGDTILLVECRDSGLQWPQPGDLDIRTLEQHYRHRDPKGPSSIHADGFHVAFADGAVWFLSNETPWNTLLLFLTIEGAAAHDREDELAPYRLD